MRGLSHARETCRRWLRDYGPDPNVEEWSRILERPWLQIKSILLDDSEEGKRLRQNSPFAGVLPPRQRWDTIGGSAMNRTQLEQRMLLKERFSACQ